MATPRLSWKVTSVATDQTVTDQSNNVVIGSYIYYFTGNGNRGVVFIDNDHLKPDNVQTAIRTDARNLDAIAALAENWPEG
jgi:hypothetical protein